MNFETIKDSIGEMDIYIIDQVLKGRYEKNSKILDAGCGSGRNLKWFYNSSYSIYGIDINLDDIEYCKQIYLKQRNNFKQASLEKIPFKENYFDHVLCNAVLHFAEDLSQYLQFLNELFRILKPGGSLFIRMASNFGMENDVIQLSNNNYKLPDGSKRFLLTTEILKLLQKKYKFSFLEDVKTTIVHQKRCMTTLVLKKE